MKKRENKKKKILFIAPNFFGYYKEVIKELQKCNCEVDYFCDAPSNTNISKALSRLNRNIIKFSMNKYFHKEIIPVISKKKYDYVFIIIGMTFSFFPKMIKEIKEKNKDAKFIMYQWDGEKNISFVNEIHNYFDYIYTFDRGDCEKNKKYSFLPLFYTRNYENVGKRKNVIFEYDVSYIGTAHPQKLLMVNKMSEQLKDIFKRQYIYHYMPSRFKFIYHKLTSKEYKGVKLSDLKLKKVPLEKTMEIFEKSKCIFDAPQKGQTGLTIRTIECLGAKRKIITTNKDIKNYDFYNENNIYIYDGDININAEFFKKDFEEIPKELYEKYSLRNWLKTMIKDL